MKKTISVTGLIQVFLLVLLCGTLIGFFDSHFWICDLAVHFRLIYFAAAFLLLIPIILKKNRLSLTAVSMVLALNAVSLHPYLFKTTKADITGSEITFFHANLLSSNREFPILREEIAKANPSIVLLEEFTSEWQDNLDWLRSSYPYYKEVPQNDNFGIALYSNIPLDTIYSKDYSGVGIVSLIATSTIGNKQLQIIGTHPVPPANSEMWQLRNSHIEAIAADVAQESDIPTVVLGDFNATPWSATMRQFTKRSGLMDTMKGHLFQSSWRSGIPMLNLPIDNCYYCKDMHLISRSMGAHIGSDHLPLSITLSLLEKEIKTKE